MSVGILYLLRSSTEHQTLCLNIWIYPHRKVISVKRSDTVKGRRHQKCKIQYTRWSSNNNSKIFTKKSYWTKNGKEHIQRSTKKIVRLFMFLLFLVVWQRSVKNKHQNWVVGRHNIVHTINSCLWNRTYVSKKGLLV